MNTLQVIISDTVHEVTIKEYNGQRVVTLRDIDELHQRKSGMARDTFNRNKKYFVEEEDYFVCQTHEANQWFGLKAPNGLILLTESGYLLLVKTFTDDLAWQVQRQLVKSYFKVKQAYQVQEVPTSQEDIMIFALQNQKEMKQRLDALEAENRKLTLIVDNNLYLDDHQLAKVQESVRTRIGKLKSKGYDTHFQSLYTALNTFYTVPKYNKILRKDFDEAMEYINGWYPKKSEEVQ
jgi:phage regulator Rha-like protein